MVDLKEKTNDTSGTPKEDTTKRAKRLEYIALYKSTGKSEWSLFPQMFIDKKQAEHKIELSVQAETVHVIKLELPG